VKKSGLTKDTRKQKGDEDYWNKGVERSISGGVNHEPREKNGGEGRCLSLEKNTKKKKKGPFFRGGRKREKVPAGAEGKLDDRAWSLTVQEIIRAEGSQT